MTFLKGKNSVWCGFYEIQKGSYLCEAITIQPILLRLLKKDGTENSELIEKIRSQV